MKNRIVFGLVAFMLLCLMASPTSSRMFNEVVMPASTDIPLETNWFTADLPEGAY